jgi:hypothetical protein
VQTITDLRSIPSEHLKALPFGDALRVAEAASQEDESSVQDLWSRLIANALDPSLGISIRKVYIVILKALSPAEVAFLDLLFACAQTTHFKTRDEVQSFTADMNRLADNAWRRYPREERDVAIQNLMRIRCVTFRPFQINVQNLFARLPNERNPGLNFERWAAIDPEKFQRLLNELMEMISVAAGISDHTRSGPIPLTPRGFFAGADKIDVPEMNFTLTPLGRSLMHACHSEF